MSNNAQSTTPTNNSVPQDEIEFVLVETNWMACNGSTPAETDMWADRWGIVFADLVEDLARRPSFHFAIWWLQECLPAGSKTGVCAVPINHVRALIRRDYGVYLRRETVLAAALIEGWLVDERDGVLCIGVAPTVIEEAYMDGVVPDELREVLEDEGGFITQSPIPRASFRPGLSDR